MKKISNIKYLIFSILLLIPCFSFFIFALPVRAADDQGCCTQLQKTPPSCSDNYYTTTYITNCISQGGMERMGYCFKIQGCPGYQAPSAASSPSAVLPAVTTKPVTPEQNPMCWTAEACKAAVTSQFGPDVFKMANWEQGGPNKICDTTDKKLGVCLPAGTTPLSIKIGGAVEAKDLGDYIKIIYQYLVGIGAIVAAVLIIWAGFEWVTSAGSERIKAAQSRIGNALMGLILLLGSYLLLYTINPDLVRLRLPGVYMIRQVSMGTEWCKDLPAGTLVAKQGTAKSSAEVPLANFIIGINPDIGSWTEMTTKVGSGLVPVCGQKYFWKNSNDQTCQGHLCASEAGKPQVCVKGAFLKYYCRAGNIFGKATAANVEWGNEPVNDGSGKIICNDGNSNSYSPCSDFDFNNNEANSTEFILICNETMLTNQKAECENKHGGFAGFFLGLKLDDPDIIAIDDWKAVGCVSEPNLAKKLFPEGTKPGDMQLSDVLVYLKKNGQSAVDKIKDSLLSIEQVKNGTVCNVDLDKFNTD